MRTTLRIAAIVLSLPLINILSGCGPKETPAANPALMMTPVESNSHAHQWDYAQARFADLFGGRFEALEKEAVEPSYNRSFGTPPADAFFKSFEYKGWLDTPPDWDSFFRQLDAWDAAFPKSPVSRIARTKALINYAWEARGKGYADTVTEEGWRLMGERLRTALASLQQAQTRGGEDYPAYWHNYLNLALGLGAKQDDALKLADKALSKFRDDAGIYSGTCCYLLPRWHGDPGQWQAWLKSKQDHVEWGKNGMPAALYARIMWRVYVYIEDELSFEDPNLSWPKTREGLDELCKEYPDSDHWKTARAVLAWTALDRATFIRAVDKMEGRYDSWLVYSGDLQKALNWAGLNGIVKQ
jgi:hypothetical protein